MGAFMPKRKKDDSFLSNMIDQVIYDAETQATEEGNIADIITFCEDERYLNLSKQNPPLKLWPMQRIVLKMFYRGTRGNEHLKLNEEELGILKEINETEVLDYKEKNGGFQQVIDKYNRGHKHNTLLLVMGRRSSKTLMVSIIAAYEACPDVPILVRTRFVADRDDARDLAVELLRAVGQEQVHPFVRREGDERPTRRQSGPEQRALDHDTADSEHHDRQEHFDEGEPARIIPSC